MSTECGLAKVLHDEEMLQATIQSCCRQVPKERPIKDSAKELAEELDLDMQNLRLYRRDDESTLGAWLRVKDNELPRPNTVYRFFDEDERRNYSDLELM